MWIVLIIVAVIVVVVVSKNKNKNGTSTNSQVKAKMAERPRKEDRMKYGSSYDCIYNYNDTIARWFALKKFRVTQWTGLLNQYKKVYK